MKSAIKFQRASVIFATDSLPKNSLSTQGHWLYQQKNKNARVTGLSSEASGTIFPSTLLCNCHQMTQDFSYFKSLSFKITGSVVLYAPSLPITLHILVVTLDGDQSTILQKHAHGKAFKTEFLRHRFLSILNHDTLSTQSKQCGNRCRLCNINQRIFFVSGAFYRQHTCYFIRLVQSCRGWW